MRGLRLPKSRRARAGATAVVLAAFGAFAAMGAPADRPSRVVRRLAGDDAAAAWTRVAEALEEESSPRGLLGAPVVDPRLDAALEAEGLDRAAFARIARDLLRSGVAVEEAERDDAWSAAFDRLPISLDLALDLRAVSAPVATSVATAEARAVVRRLVARLPADEARQESP